MRQEQVYTNIVPFPRRGIVERKNVFFFHEKREILFLIYFLNLEKFS